MQQHSLNITAEHCPMTFVKVKLKLAAMAPGDTLDVTLTEGEPLTNVPRAAREQGYEVLAIRHEADGHHVVIRKPD